VNQRFRKRVPPAVGDVLKHPEESEIGVDWCIAQKKRLTCESRFTRRQQRYETGKEVGVISAPFVDTADAEFSLFVTDNQGLGYDVGDTPDIRWVYQLESRKF